MTSCRSGCSAIDCQHPLGALEIQRLWSRTGRELNQSLAGTARLHLLFGVTYTVGLLV